MQKHCDKCSYQTSEGLAITGCGRCGCHEPRQKIMKPTQIVDEVFDKIKKDGADYKEKEDAKKNLQTSADYLSDLCLENSGVHYEFTDMDLANATQVFAFFLLDAIYTVNKDKMEFSKQKALALYSGKAIRELVQLLTGKDIKKIIENL